MSGSIISEWQYCFVMSGSIVLGSFEMLKGGSNIVLASFERLKGGTSSEREEPRQVGLLTTFSQIQTLIAR